IKSKTQEDQIRSMLEECHLKDERSEPIYDGLVALAAMICETPVALISAIEGNRKWIKAKVGLPGSGTTLHSVFGVHTLSHPGLLLVDDTSRENRFCQSPFVKHFNIRFYAGVALKINGVPLGTICVMDHKPRTLTAKQRQSLRLLGAQTESQLELRRT